MFNIEGFNITWLPGVKNSIINIKKKMINNICSLKNIKVNWDFINIEYWSNYQEYFDKLKNNIVIISTYNSNANNAILDIISLKVPALIERNKSIEEYIGIDYPGFFNINEINKILSDSDKLKVIIKNSKKYLEDNYNKLLNELSIDLFLDTINYIINDIKLTHLHLINNNIIKLDSNNKKNKFNKMIDTHLIIDYFGKLDDINENDINKISNMCKNGKNIIVSKNNKVISKFTSKKNNLYELLLL